MGRAVGTDEPRFHIFCDVRDRGFFVQVPQALLAFAELLLEVKARQLAGGLLREDAKGEQLPRLLRHWTVVEGCDVAENRSFGIAQRHSQKTFDAPRARVRVVREILPYSRGVVAQIPVNHVFTRRARQSPFEIFSDAVPVREGDGTGLGMVLRRRELRDECPARVNHTRQIRTSAWKYSSPLLARGCLDDRTERREFFGLPARHVGWVRGR